MAKIDPIEWLRIAIQRKPQSKGFTEWFPGTISPVHVGLYERHFTDSMINRPEDSWQWWDGTHWRVSETGNVHWLQVGEYPAWRGLACRFVTGQEVTLTRGSRGRSTGQGCERKIRARLNSIDPCGLVSCTLLEDDSLATASPFLAGERGSWHGLSFLL